MPRNRYSNSHHSASSATIVAANRILQKGPQYKNDIKKLHANASIFAETIAISGPAELALRNDGDNNDPENEEMEAFMNEQRMRLKNLTERHVNSSRYVDAFMNAADSIKADIAQNGEQKEDGEGEASASASDYETMLQTKLEFEKHNIEKNSIEVKDEEMSRKIRKYLKEKEPAKQGDDDEIEVEVTQSNRESELKCPLTGMLFQNPYRNKLCGHVYDLHGIQQHLRIKKDCPVMGCKNKNVTMEALEPDEEMKLKVRRYIHRRDEQKRINAMSQDYDLDDDEDEEGGGGGETGGMTLIE